MVAARWHQPGNSVKVESQGADTLQLPGLQRQEPDRANVQQSQTVPQNRHPARQNQNLLLRVPKSGHSASLVTRFCQQDLDRRRRTGPPAPWPRPLVSRPLLSSKFGKSTGWHRIDGAVSNSATTRRSPKNCMMLSAYTSRPRSKQSPRSQNLNQMAFSESGAARLLRRLSN